MLVSKDFLNPIIYAISNLLRKILFNSSNFGHSSCSSFFLVGTLTTALFSLDPTLSSNDEGVQNPLVRFIF